jgi:hypothetical protein
LVSLMGNRRLTSIPGSKYRRDHQAYPGKQCEAPEPCP